MKIGKHLVVEFINCQEKDLLIDYNIAESILFESVNLSGAEILDSTFHRFKNNEEIMGYTQLFLLAESHFSIHTYPEYNYAAIDIFTCGNKCIPENTINYLKEKFKPETVIEKIIKRGF